MPQNNTARLQSAQNQWSHKVHSPHPHPLKATYLRQPLFIWAQYQVLNFETAY